MMMQWPFSFDQNTRVRDLTAADLFELIGTAVSQGNIESQRSVDTGARQADQVRDVLNHRKQLLSEGPLGPTLR